MVEAAIEAAIARENFIFAEGWCWLGWKEGSVVVVIGLLK